MIDSEIQFWNAPNSGSGTWDTAGGAATATQRMTIDESGNVGIGTASPQDLLHIYGVGDSTLRVETDTGQAQLLLRAGATTRRACRIDFSRADTGTQYMQIIGDYAQNATDDLTVASSTSGRIMTWLQNGNVGIGTTSPDTDLHIYGSTSQTNIFLGETGTPDKAGIIKYFQGDNSSNPGRLAFGSWGDNFSTGASTMCIKKGGFVGIGTNSPAAKLHIGPKDNDHIYLASSNNSYGWTIDTDDQGSGTVPFRIIKRTGGVDSTVLTIKNQDGKIGIGLNNPDNTLDVRGNMNVSFDDNSRMKIDSGGTVRRHYLSGGTNYGAGLHFTSNAIFPTDYAGNYVNNQIDLGTSARKWKGVHTEYLACGGSGQVPVTFTSSSTWQTSVNIGNSTVPSNTWSFLLGGSGNNTGAAGVGSLGFYVNNGNGFVLNLNANGNVGIGTTSPGAKLDVNGYIAHNNPVFYAHNFGNGGGGTTSSNYIVYRNTEVNVGSNFSTSTGIFTCPRNGVYKFTWGAIANNSDTVYRYYIRINNANIINGTHNRIDNTANGSNFGNGTSSIILTLSTNDTVRIFYIADNGSTSSYGYNYDIFMGYMISA